MLFEYKADTCTAQEWSQHYCLCESCTNIVIQYTTHSLNYPSFPSNSAFLTM